jgi:hypothetical protein
MIPLRTPGVAVLAVLALLLVVPLALPGGDGADDRATALARSFVAEDAGEATRADRDHALPDESSGEAAWLAAQGLGGLIVLAWALRHARRF